VPLVRYGVSSAAFVLYTVVMNKNRLEALSDGVFAIVMTLLIFDIKVPHIEEPITNEALLSQLGILWPHMVVYAGTFFVLSAMWINHHFLFQMFAKEVDRRLNLLNLVYLMFVAFFPFAASFIGEYHAYQVATILYGINLLAITFLSIAMLRYIRLSQGVEHLPPRLLNQSRFRFTVNITCYLVAILVSFWNVHISLLLYIFPVIFNIIPGTLDFTERLFGFDLGERF
jgi:uncharacterized membrane protein